MITLIRSPIDRATLEQTAQDIPGYVKFVVDIKLGIATIGGLRHLEGEQLLLQNGSSQTNLWGGGLDLATGEIDFDSMINIRPNQNNPSREVLDGQIRDQMAQIMKKLIP